MKTIQRLLLAVFFVYSISAYSVTLTVSNLNDSGSGSLRDAMATAMAAASGTNYTIQFATALGASPQTINLASSIGTGAWYNNMAGTITIDGTGLTNKITIKGTGVGDVLSFQSGNINIRNVAITGGDVGVHFKPNGNMSNISVVNCHIFGNNQQGIFIDGSYSNATIQGNTIGLNLAGNVSGNGYDGILINGGSGHIIGGSSVQANIIVANGWKVTQAVSGWKDFGNGISIYACAGASIQGNYVGTSTGTNVNIGTDFLGNGRHGIYTNGSNNITIGGTYPNITGNNGFGQSVDYPASGIALYNGSTNVTIKSNYIGTNNLGSKIGNCQDGVTINFASNNTVQSNVVCNNWHGIGVRFSANNNNVLSNIVGTDGTNRLDLGNGQTGISIESTSSGNTLDGNTVKGNNGNTFKYNTLNNPAGKVGGGGYGIWIVITSNGNFVYNNTIGRASGDNVALSNSGDGIHIEQSSNNNTIGGAGKANTISLNGGDGVEVNASNNNLISQNKITANTGMGIKLVSGNGGQASPLIKKVAGTTVSGTAVAGSTIEVFADNGTVRACDDPLKRQGATYLGATTALADGTWSFTNAGVVEATVSATSTSGLNTSEFNTCPLCFNPIISDPGTVCANQTGIVFTNSQNPAEADWSITPAGAATITSVDINTKSITVTAGTVNFTVTAIASGCSASRNVTVTPLPTDPTSATSDRPSICSPATGNVQLTLTGGGGTGSTVKWYTGSCGGTLVGTGAVLSIAAPTSTTTYYGRWENGTCYSACQSTTITITTTPTNPTSASSDRPSICSPATGNVQLTLIGGGGTGSTVKWYTGSCGGTLVGTGAVLSIAAPTSTTTYYGRWENGTCYSTCQSTTIIITTTPTNPTSASSDRPSICSPATGNVQLTLTGGGGTGSTVKWYTGSCGGTLVGTGAVLSIAAPTSTTTYYGRWENGTCYSTCQSTTITISTPPTISISGPTDLCTGSTITLTASGGNSYSWSTGETSSSITISGQGLYTVTGTGANNCQGTDSKNITEKALPSVSIAGSNVFCTGNTVTLTASGATSYSWSSGANTSSITVGTAGSYTVTGTGANGCKNTDTKAVSEVSKPTISITGPSEFCSGKSVTLIASGGDSYVWSNGGATTGSITVTTGGTYTVTGKVGSGSGSCENTATQVVTENQNPTASASADVAICEGQSTTLDVTVSGGTAPYTYSWTPNTSLDDASSKSPVANPTGTIEYTVLVTDSKTCTNQTTEKVLVTVNKLPVTSSITGLNPVCEQSSGIDYSVTNNPGSTFTWSTPTTGITIVSGNGTNAIKVDFAAGITSGVISVLEKSSDNCPAANSESINIIIKAQPTLAAAGADQAFCVNTQNFADLNANPATVGTGLWTSVPSATFDDATSPTAKASNLSAGTTYTFTWTISNSPCTASSDDVKIKVDRVPVAPNPSASKGLICETFEGDIILDANTTDGDGATLEWHSGASCSGAILGTEKLLTVQLNKPTADLTYSVRWVGNTCSATDCNTLTITVDKSPGLTSTPKIVDGPNFCPERDTKIELNIVPPTDNTWVPVWYKGKCGDTVRADGLIPNDTIFIDTPLETTTYFVRYETRVCGVGLCDKATVIINKVAVNLIPEIGLCKNIGADTLFVPAAITPLTSFEWIETPGARPFDEMFVGFDKTPGSQALDPIINTRVPGGPFKYVLVVKNPGCSDIKDTVSISIFSLPSVTLVSDNDTVCVGTPIKLTATANVAKPFAYAWTTSDKSFIDTIEFKKFEDIVNPYILDQKPSAHDSLIYYVTVVDSNGCWSDSAHVKLNIRDEQRLKVPNLITPNNDGHNDCWKIYDENGSVPLPGTLVQVFNRWGESVYKNNNYKIDDFCGSILADGIYYYYVKPGCGTREEKSWLQIISNTEESSNK